MKKFYFIPLSILLFLGHFMVAQNLATVVKDINAGANSSNPTDYVAHNNAVYFTATSGSTSSLYKTDGTTVGTQPFNLVLPNGSTRLSNLFTLNGKTFLFGQSQGRPNIELWRLDAETPILVERIDSLPIINIASIKIQDGQAYFTAERPNAGCNTEGGYYFLRTAGTTGSTRFIGKLVSTCVSGGSGGNVTNTLRDIGQGAYIIESNSYFTSSPVVTVNKSVVLIDEAGNRKELSNEGSTTVNGVNTVNSNRLLGYPIEFIGAMLYITRADSLFSVTASTNPVFIKKGIGEIRGRGFKVGNTIDFVNNRGEFWRTDGTANGTVLLSAANAGPVNIGDAKVIGSTLYLLSINGRNYDIWSIAPNQTAPTRVSNICGDCNIGGLHIAVINDQLYAFAQLRFATATLPIGTYLIEKVGATTFTGLGVAAAIDFDISNYIYFNGNLLLSAEGFSTPATGRELAKVSLPPSVLTAYCASKSNAPWEEWVAKVQFNDLNNASEKTRPDLYVVGYSNWKDKSANVNKGQTYPLSITPGLSYPTLPTNLFTRAWIDYNQNGTFEDNEKVLEQNNGNAFVTQPVAIPTTALVGATAMRVSTKKDAYPTACETFAAGEVEDYTVNITANAFTRQDTLRVTNVVAPATVVPGQNITVNATIENVGSAPGDPNRKFRLFDYGQIPNQGRVSLNFYEPISNEVAIGSVIAPRATQTIPFTVRVDSNWTHKKTFPVPQSQIPVYLGAAFGQSNLPPFSTVGRPDTSPFNFLFSFPLSSRLVAILPEADLSVTATAPSLTYSGNELSYTVRVKNNSAIAAPQTEVRVFDLPFLFTNALLTPSRGTVATPNFTNLQTIVAGYWYVGTLAPNEEATCQVSVSAAAFGFDIISWTITPFVQSLRTNDPVASNNQATLTFRRATAPTPADTLKITNVVAPASVVPGQNITLTATIQNVGNAPSDPNRKLRLFDNSLAPQRPFTVYSYESISTEVPIGAAIAPGAMRTNQYTVKVDSNWTHKKTFLVPQAPFFYVNDGAAFGLSSTSRQFQAIGRPDTLPFNFPLTAILPNADLSVTASAPSLTYSSNELFYTVRIKNNSGIAAPQTEVRLFDLPSPFLTASLLPSRGTTATYNQASLQSYVAGYWYNIGTLAPNEEATCQVRVSSSEFDFPNTGYTVFPVVQSLKTNEPAPTNNTTALTFQRIASNLPDLTLANLNIPTPSVQQGQILSYNVDIKNIGMATATGLFNVKAYISTDNILSADDVQNGTIPTGNFAAGLNQVQVVGASLIATTIPAGQYYLILKVDADNQITEGDEGNNVLVSATTFTVTTTPITSPICSNSLLTNGGYENGLTGWFGGGQITASANSGASAIKICADQQRVLQTVPAQAGKTYLLRAFAKTDDATGRTMGFINFKFLSNSYVPLLDRTLGGFNATTYTNVLASPALGLDAYSLAAPAGTAFVEISVTKSGGTGCVYIDDWCLTSAATTDPCVNDFISPTFTNCPTAARTVTLASGQTSTVVNWTVPTATDDCGTPSVIQASNFQNGGSYGVGTLGIIYEAKDSKGNLGSCSFTINVVGSTTGSTADIAVSINSTPSVFSPFSTLNMAIGAKNVGTQAMTNVKIEFKYPTGTVSGGAAIPSVGTWNEWCSGGIQCFTWTIPSLAANATATLNLPLYVLNPTSPIIATAKLLSSTPLDGNLANNTASITINKATTAPAIATLSRQAPTQFLPVVVQSVEPTLVETEVFLNVGSIVEKEVEFAIFNTMGKLMQSEKRQIAKGENRLQFDVFSLPSGMYLIAPNTTSARNVPMKFIKL